MATIAAVNRAQAARRAHDELRPGDGPSGAKLAMQKQAGAAAETLTLRDKLWQALDDPSSSRPAYVFSIVVLILILLSCTAFVVETVPSMCCGRYDHIWGTIEAICVSVFSFEYIVRLALVPPKTNNEGMFALSEENNRGALGEVVGRLRFFLQFLNLVDFAAIFPTWLQLFIGSEGGSEGTQFLRVIRLARVFRLFKLSKYSEGMWLLSATMVRSWRALGMLGFFMLIEVVLFSSVMYFVERGEFFYCDQASVDLRLCKAEELWPAGVEVVGRSLTECSEASVRGFACCRDGEGWYADKDDNMDGCMDRSQYDSIVATAWWCVVTMTTVGYGDVVPHSWLGQLLATLTMLSGILILALPITVIGSNFNIEYEKKEAEKRLNEELEAMMGSTTDAKTPPEEAGEPGGSAANVVQAAAPASPAPGLKASTVQEQVDSRPRIPTYTFGVPALASGCARANFLAAGVPVL